MDIDFKNIRPLHGDQKLGFEEFCSQMAEIDVEREAGPNFVRHQFHRKEGKGGDAGVECYYAFPDGREWGWQAKYFIDGLGPAQWKQINKSVQKALAGHPRLERYTICLPVDLSDARVQGKTSQWNHWEKHKIEWTQWARDRGTDVEFTPWGEFDLRQLLLDLGDRSAGYILYWFNEKILTDDWFLARFSEAKNDADARYTPEIHVDLPISRHFDAFGRTGTFLDTIASLYHRLLRRWKDAKQWSEIRQTEEIAEAATGLGHQVDALAQALGHGRTEAFQEIDFDGVLHLAAEGIKQNSHCMGLAKRVRCDKQGSEQRSSDSESVLEHDLSGLQSVFADIANFTAETDARIAGKQAVLLSGEAGTGKTHLFCDLAEKRIKQGLPTVLLLGQHFSPGRLPLYQIVEQLLLGPTEPTKFLGALDAAARARGKRAMILIDALSEGAGAKLWKANLARILTTLSKYERIVLAVSCRESYVDDVLPENLLKPDRMCRLWHHGFEGYEFNATQSFFRHYGIQSPAEPLLVSEFSNPLFLKLLCKGLANEGRKHVPKGLKGITQLFQFFIDAVNRKLSKSLGMDEKDNVVSETVDALAQRMAEKEQNWLERKEAKEIIHRVRPEPSEYERMLFRNLIHEGLLREERPWFTAEQARIEVVRFAYERLGDHLMVSRWLRAAAGLKEPKDNRRALPVVKKMAEDNVFARRHAGWLEAMSMQCPESFDRELIELHPALKESSVFRRAFLHSLLWRDPQKVSEGAVEFFNEIVDYGTQGEFELAMEVLLMVACDPEHLLNAESLHEWLSGLCMGDRDHIWSIFLHHQYEWKEEGPVHRLIDWA